MKIRLVSGLLILSYSDDTYSRFLSFLITKILFLLEQKLRLKSDFEKELAELRRKYDVKFQEIEVEFQQTKKTLDTNLNTVYVNKILANAFKSKCLDLKVSGALGVQHGMFVFHRHLSFNIAFTFLTWLIFNKYCS